MNSNQPSVDVLLAWLREKCAESVLEIWTVEAVRTVADGL